MEVEVIAEVAVALLLPLVLAFYWGRKEAREARELHQVLSDLARSDEAWLDDHQAAVERELARLQATVPQEPTRG